MERHNPSHSGGAVDRSGLCLDRQFGSEVVGQRSSIPPPEQNVSRSALRFLSWIRWTCQICRGWLAPELYFSFSLVYQMIQFARFILLLRACCYICLRYWFDNKFSVFLLMLSNEVYLKYGAYLKIEYQI